MLLETHSMGVLVKVTGVFSGYYRVDGTTALLCGSRSARPWLERKPNPTHSLVLFLTPLPFLTLYLGFYLHSFHLA